MIHGAPFNYSFEEARKQRSTLKEYLELHSHGFGHKHLGFNDLCFKIVETNE